jgi:guanylate kinase
MVDDAETMCRALLKLGFEPMDLSEQNEESSDVKARRKNVQTDCSNPIGDLVGLTTSRSSDEIKDFEVHSHRLVAGSDQRAAMFELMNNASPSGAGAQIERRRFEGVGCFINVDTLPLAGSFLSIAASQTESGERTDFEENLVNLRAALNLGDELFVPWSHRQLLSMYAAAEKYRKVLAATTPRGVLFLIDGPSGSGKSTVTEALSQRVHRKMLQFVPRYSTRQPRYVGDNEYIFVSMHDFESIRSTGGFIDSKDFLFGMSYGLAWADVAKNLFEGRSVLSPMNWGNGVQVKHLFPECKIIQIAAPEHDLRRRLESRGVHDLAQLEERLGNARRFAATAKTADLLIMNVDGQLETNLQIIEDYILKNTK